MKQHIKGLRSVPRKVTEVVAAGRSLEQQVEDIRKEGMYFTPSVLRNSIIGGLEIRRRKKTAENLIVIGCACYGTAMPLRSYFLLLDRLGLDYTFLDKEYCCGLPLIQHQLLQGEARGPADEAAREFLGLNIARARELGVSRMVYFCTWCAYLAKRFYPEEEIAQLYFPDILLEPLSKRRLSLEGASVGYFGGPPHRKPILLPDRDLDLDWLAYRRLLDSIEGLRVVPIPRYCCQIADWAIFQRAQREGLSTLVTSCIVCYGRLWRRAPQGFQVKFLSDLLLEALPEGGRAG